MDRYYMPRNSVRIPNGLFSTIGNNYSIPESIKQTPNRYYRNTEESDTLNIHPDLEGSLEFRKLLLRNRFYSLLKKPGKLLKKTRSYGIFFAVSFTIFIGFILFGLRVYLSLGTFRMSFKPDQQKIRDFFYLIDVCTFEDSEGDGKGDFLGIARNLDALKQIGVTHLVLTTVCKHVIHSTPKFNKELNVLIKKAHSRKIKIIWDITDHVEIDLLHVFPKGVDALTEE